MTPAATPGWEPVSGADARPGGTPVTLVTALLDVGRADMPKPFARSFADDDLVHFRRLLATPLPLVVYLDPRFEDEVWARRQRENTQVIPFTPLDLEACFPYFERVQALRTDPAWLAQTPWLRLSPQAVLPRYAPLSLSRPRFLAAQAAANPFASSHLFWVDPSLCRAVGDAAVCDPSLGDRLIAVAGDRCLWVAYPSRGPGEIQGFPRAAVAAYARRPVEEVQHVVRGALFGGSVSGVRAVAALYARVLERTLAEGYLGTEESLLTILAHRDAHLYRAFAVAEDGLLGPFFRALRDGLEHLTRLDLTAASAPASAA